jgi:hypothetical protein
MTETPAVYHTKAKATPPTARMALSYRNALAQLREAFQACDEIAEDRDRAIIEIERLNREVKKLVKEIEKLRGKA